MQVDVGKGVLDTILTNGRIRPVPGEGRRASAIGLRGGLVSELGSEGDVAAGAGPRTNVIDLAGRTVLPAFIDSHTHFHRGSVLSHLFLDFETLAPASLADVLAVVTARAATRPRGTWIQGDSLSAARLAEGRLPGRRELDAAAPEHAVVLRGIGKHVVAANSVALAAAGITRDTEDPPGGRIERDDTGEPTGILHERAKLRLDTSRADTVVPAPSREDRFAALRMGFRNLHAHGVTAIHEMVRAPEEVDDLALLHQAGQLRARVGVYYRIWETTLTIDALERFGIRTGLGDSLFRVLGVKVSVDGFCIVRNAAVYEPYASEPENRGIIRIEQPELEDLVRRANAQGLQVAVHAVGPRAVDSALAAFESAGPAPLRPYRLEHAYVDVDRRTFDRMRELGVILSTQPGFLGSYQREWRAGFGVDRAATIMPLRQAFDAGLEVLLNSDYPCSPVDPLEGIRLAATRMVDGAPVAPSEAISPAEAWRSFTTVPARVVGEDRLGHLRPGALADLVVLDDDPFASPSALSTASISATMMGGQFVYDAGGEWT